MNKDTFETSDLPLAAFLECQDFEILDIKSITPSKSSFIFKRSPKLEDIVRKYYRNEVQVAPLTFFNTIKKIKSMIKFYI
jgi:hypothetical protein